MSMDRDYRFQPGPLGDFNQKQQQNHLQARPLTAEEIEEWNSCMRESIIKGGLPFAIGMQALNAFLRSRAANKTNVPSGPPPPPPGVFNVRPKLLFLGNFIVGLFLYTPVCYRRLQTKFIATQEKLLKEKEEGIVFTKAEGGILQTDDAIMRGGLDSNFEGAEKSFSHLDLDFDTSVGDKVILEDAQDQKSRQSMPETTYDNLRRLNRENFNRNLTFPASSARDDPRQSSRSSPVQRPDEPQPKKVTRNKYGDEMES